MKVLPDHWLEGVNRQLIPGGAAMDVRRFLVIHFTAGASAMSSIDYWRTSAAAGASAHLVIDRDGTIFQCRPFNRTCGHAGKSSWVDPAGTQFTGLNACSIGIELANGGSSYPTKFSKLPPLKQKAHKNGGPKLDWETYTAEQLAACEAVSRVLVARYRLDDVIGHEDIAPDRKTDPGPAFPMGDLRVACGFPREIVKR